MNKGLIIGKVTDRSGNDVSEAEVVMPQIRGMAGGRIIAKGEKNSDLGSPKTETNSNGYFELVFSWSGTEIGTVIGGAGRTAITLFAGKTIQHDSRSSTQYNSGNRIITGYMIKDMMGMAGLTPQSLKNMPEILQFSKKMIDSALKLKSHPLFRTNMLTSESWIILSAANLVINKY